MWRMFNDDVSFRNETETKTDPLSVSMLTGLPNVKKGFCISCTVHAAVGLNVEERQKTFREQWSSMQSTYTGNAPKRWSVVKSGDHRKNETSLFVSWNLRFFSRMKSE